MIRFRLPFILDTTLNLWRAKYSLEAQTGLTCQHTFRLGDYMHGPEAKQLGYTVLELLNAPECPQCATAAASIESHFDAERIA